MLDPVLPIAIYLLFGYLFKIIFQDNSKQLVDFIIYFSLPAIVFSKIYPLELDTKILWLILMFMAIIFFNLFLSYCVGKMMRLNRVTLATFMIMATFGNTSFIGFSYIDAFYGQDYIVYGVIYDIFGSFLLLVSVGMIIITWGSGRKNSVLNISVTHNDLLNVAKISASRSTATKTSFPFAAVFGAPVTGGGNIISFVAIGY